MCIQYCQFEVLYCGLYIVYESYINELYDFEYFLIDNKLIKGQILADCMSKQRDKPLSEVWSHW